MPTGRVFEQICERVREQISAGTLKPGDKLPAERDLAQQFGAGRNAVREALRSLEIAGLVRLEKGRSGGAFIRPGNPARMTLAMQDLLDVGSIGLLELFEARMQIMDRVVRLASARATPATFDQLEHALDDASHYKSLGQYDRRVDSIVEFYAVMAQATGNRVLTLIVAALNDTVRQFIVESRATPPTQDTLVAGLRRVLRHMRAGDAERASAELGAQLLSLYRLLEQGFQSQGQSGGPSAEPVARTDARPAAKTAARKAATSAAKPAPP